MLVLSILVVATVLRLWRLDNTLQFLGDQGRDALIAWKIGFRHDLALIGPVTSTGNMYLGPLYYYFMVPFLWLSFPAPTGPVYAVVLLSILTIWLVYKLGKEMVGEDAAVIAAFLMSVSAVAITHSRFSWNPNLAPLFGLLFVWSVWRMLTQRPAYVILVSMCFSVLIQLHYVTLLALPVSGVAWLYMVYGVWVRREKKEIREAFLSTLLAIAVFFISLVPLMLFDWRHDWLNWRSFQVFLHGDGGGFTDQGKGISMWKAVRELHGRSMLLLVEMFLGKARRINTLLTATVVTSLTFLAWRAKNHTVAYRVLLGSLAAATLGLSFYQSTVFYHYVAFLYPVTFLLYGVLLSMLWNARTFFRGGKLVVLGFLVWFLVWNAQHWPLKPLSFTWKDTQRAAETILDRVKPGEKYNIVLLTGTGDIEGLNYRYFLETSDKPPLPKERWGETETLFIINEDKKLATVTDSPIYEIVVFPNKKRADVYTIPNGPDITILRR